MDAWWLSADTPVCHRQSVTCSTIVGGMTTRLPRGTRTTPKRLGYAIEEADKLRLEKIAEKSGVSAAVFVELMVRNLPLTDQGIPTWMPPQDRDGELPIDSA